MSLGTWCCDWCVLTQPRQLELNLFELEKLSRVLTCVLTAITD